MCLDYINGLCIALCILKVLNIIFLVADTTLQLHDSVM